VSELKNKVTAKKLSLSHVSDVFFNWTLLRDQEVKANFTTNKKQKQLRIF
jgi:hypothetical protein